MLKSLCKCEYGSFVGYKRGADGEWADLDASNQTANTTYLYKFVAV